MSAFLVSEKHIQALVTYAARHLGTIRLGQATLDLTTPEGKRELGQRLWDENLRSVNFRYREQTEPVVYKHKMVPSISAVQILKAIHCLSYQSCESNDWEETQAYSVLKQIESSAVRNVPGYDEAAWGIE